MSIYIFFYLHNESVLSCVIFRMISGISPDIAYRRFSPNRMVCVVKWWDWLHPDIHNTLINCFVTVCLRLVSLLRVIWSVSYLLKWSDPQAFMRGRECCPFSDCDNGSVVYKHVYCTGMREVPLTGLTSYNQHSIHRNALVFCLNSITSITWRI